MIDSETQTVRTIHAETEKGIRVCKFGKMIWLPKAFIDTEKTQKEYSITAPRWIWDSKRKTRTKFYTRKLEESEDIKKASL